jgi:hypothetical protein
MRSTLSAMNAALDENPCPPDLVSTATFQRYRDTGTAQLQEDIRKQEERVDKQAERVDKHREEMRKQKQEEMQLSWRRHDENANNIRIGADEVEGTQRKEEEDCLPAHDPNVLIWRRKTRALRRDIEAVSYEISVHSIPEPICPPSMFSQRFHDIRSLTNQDKCMKRSEKEMDMETMRLWLTAGEEELSLCSSEVESLDRGDMSKSEVACRRDLRNLMRKISENDISMKAMMNPSLDRRNVPLLATRLLQIQSMSEGTRQHLASELRSENEKLLDKSVTLQSASRPTTIFAELQRTKSITRHGGVPVWMFDSDDALKSRFVGENLLDLVMDNAVVEAAKRFQNTSSTSEKGPPLPIISGYSGSGKTATAIATTNGLGTDAICIYMTAKSFSSFTFKDKSDRDAKVVEQFGAALIYRMNRLDISRNLGVCSNPVCVVIDEVGGEYNLLRALCSARHKIRARLQTMLKVKSLTMIACGTGAEGVNSEPGSYPTSFELFPFPTSSTAHTCAFMKRLVEVVGPKCPGLIKWIDPDSEFYRCNAQLGLEVATRRVRLQKEMKNRRFAVLYCKSAMQFCNRNPIHRITDSLATNWANVSDTIGSNALDQYRYLNGLSGLSSQEMNRWLRVSAALCLGGPRQKMDASHRVLVNTFGIVVDNLCYITNESEPIRAEVGSAVVNEPPKHEYYLPLESVSTHHHHRYSLEPVMVQSVLNGFGVPSRPHTRSGLGFEFSIRDVLRFWFAAASTGVIIDPPCSIVRSSKGPVPAEVSAGSSAREKFHELLLWLTTMDGAHECEPHVVSLRALTKVIRWNDIVEIALREAALSTAPKLGLVIVNSDGGTADIIGALYDRKSRKGHSLWVQAKHYPYHDLSELVTMKEHYKMGVVTMATYLAYFIFQQNDEWALKRWLEELFQNGTEGRPSPTYVQWQTTLMKDLAVGCWSMEKKSDLFSHLLRECTKAKIKFLAVKECECRERSDNPARVVLLALVKDASEEGCQEVSPRAWTLKMTEATMTSAFHPLPFLPLIHPPKDRCGRREVICDPESTERLAYVDSGNTSEGANEK